jgi:single-strand DNA-binding protein
MSTATRSRGKSTRQKGESTSNDRKVEPKGPVAKVGNLTRDPELRFGTDKGTPFCRFGIAVEQPKEAGNWSGERETVFYEGTAFGSLAEHLAELVKGTRVLVIGKGELEHWTDADGNERTTKRIVVDACGPDLRWASVTVERDGRGKSTTDPEPDADGGFDEEPF